MILYTLVTHYSSLCNKNQVFSQKILFHIQAFPKEYSILFMMYKIFSIENDSQIDLYNYALRCTSKEHQLSILYVPLRTVWESIPLRFSFCSFWFSLFRISGTFWNEKSVHFLFNPYYSFHAGYKLFHAEMISREQLVFNEGTFWFLRE